MFALVDDVERYTEFLPWVSGAQIVERTESERIGRLEMTRAGLREQFTTRNVVTPPGRLEMRLLDGPFRVLEGVWTFDAIRDPAIRDPASLDQASLDQARSEAAVTRGTRIAFALRYEFKSRLTDMLLAPKVASSCDTLVDAFVKRARDIYGVAK
jgi:ribosome-associated toxin RatA of RatAB toxin-antitoxin module